MTQIIILFFFITNIFSIHAQQAFPKTWVKKSLTGNFTATVSGDFYEGFVGPQILSLFQNDSLLWKKEMERRGLHLPCVSDNGDVIITKWSNLFLYDKTGTLIWDYELKNESFCPYYGMHLDIVQTFSIDNQFYFTFIHNSKEYKTYLICNSIQEKKEEWRIGLGDFRESSIQQIKDLIVIHDFTTHSMNYINKCYILDFSGNLIWEYERYLKRDLFEEIRFDKYNNAIELVFVDEVEKYYLHEKKANGPTQ